MANKIRNVWNLLVTTESPECVQLLDGFVDEFLSYGTQSYTKVQKALEADPKCSLAYTYNLALFMFIEAPFAIPKRKEYVAQAHKYAQEQAIEDREELWMRAMSSWYSSKVDDAIEHLQFIIDAYPQDIFAAKLCQILYFMMGDIHGELVVINKIYDKNPGARYVDGMMAFALVENFDNERAEQFGKAGSAMGNDPWAQHAVAHVYDTTGQVETGISWMNNCSHSWDRCNSFMLHIIGGIWHSSISIKAMQLKVWSKSKDYSEDQMGAISLLWRCELREVPVANRWLEVSDYIAPRVREHLHPFIDLHYSYALARSGQEERLQEFLQTLEEENGGKGCQRHQDEVVIPAAKAIAEYAKGHAEKAHELLVPISNRLKEIGGSNAQQDVFMQTYEDILVRTSRWTEAKPLLEDRCIARNHNIPYTQQLYHKVLKHCPS